MNAAIALPQGYALGEYRIESTLGAGGSGLTYLATDSNLNFKVAIKEYLPGDLALRGGDHSVTPISDATLETFNWGRTRFLDESRTLASFRHPNIVRVMRFFEANRTAYMVMEFVAGQTLKDWIRERRPPAEQTLSAIVGPLLDGLEVIHRAGYVHRDIKPGNVFVREDGSPVLLDFGSARVASPNTELTAIVTPGYAPFEQYHSQGHQGPWSDLYAIGAVLYWMVTGAKPVDATARAREDPMVPAIQAGDCSRYSPQLLKAIDWALSPSEAARPQSVAEFRNALPGLASAAASGQRTVIVSAPSAAGPGPGRPSVTSGAVFDHEALKKVEAELARHVGPIASVVVKSAAKQADTLAQLAQIAGAEIPDERIRAAFVKAFAAIEKPAPAGDPGRASPQHGDPARAESALARFDAATLAGAETALAKYIGAIAKVVVKRAAAKARDESELYLLIADQIEDKNERKAFVRKAISVGRRG